ncbi:hypothetical protein Pan258_29530 [Symmachiella dynata]|nr:hypothetical protein Pan258_29530 [Symmachiella dynata]
MKRWKRIKFLSGISVVGMIAASTFGTVVSMVRTFNTISMEEKPAQNELADSISTQLWIGTILMPFVLIAAIVWFVAWLRVRDFRILSEHKNRS